MEKGFRAFMIFHESDYFKAKIFFHKNPIDAEKWIEVLCNEA
jgi:hypothetical protein